MMKRVEGWHGKNKLGMVTPTSPLPGIILKSSLMYHSSDAVRVGRPWVLHEKALRRVLVEKVLGIAGTDLSKGISLSVIP